MYLSRNKNGQIGQVVQSEHDQEHFIKPSYLDEAQGNVCFNPTQVEADTRSYLEAEMRNQSRNELHKKNRKLKEEFERQDMSRHDKLLQMQHDEMSNDMHVQSQRLGKFIMENSQLPESVRLKNSVRTDFYNLLPSKCESLRPFNKFSDFHQLEPVGHQPLADGVYGEITEFDNVFRNRNMYPSSYEVVGDTELGRVNDQPIDLSKEIRNANMGSGDSRSGEMDMAGRRQMGSWWDDLTTGIQNEFLEQAPGAIVDYAKDQLLPGQAPPPQTVYVNTPNPVPRYVGQASASLGVPPWAIYAGVGMLGIGMLAVLYRAVK